MMMNGRSLLLLLLATTSVDVKGGVRLKVRREYAQERLMVRCNGVNNDPQF